MKKWAFISVIVLLILIITQTIYLYLSASKPLVKAEERAIALIQDQLELNEIIDVTFFNGDEPYHVVHALDENSEEIIIWIPENNPEDLIVENAENGLTEEEVREYAYAQFDIKKLQNIRIGMKYNIPVWEITFIDTNDRYSFYYLQFNGETWIENYRLKAL